MNINQNIESYLINTIKDDNLKELIIDYAELTLAI